MAITSDPIFQRMQYGPAAELPTATAPNLPIGFRYFATDTADRWVIQEISGVRSFQNESVIPGDVHIGGSLFVHGDINCDGGLNVSNGADFGGDVQLDNGALILASFTVAGLPAATSDGRLAYASNGRKVGQGVGAGTGVVVYFSAGAWRVFSTDAPVAA